MFNAASTLKRPKQLKYLMKRKLLDISLRPLCTSTPTLNSKAKNNRRVSNRSLRKQALRRSVSARQSASNTSQLLNNSSKKNKRRQIARCEAAISESEDDEGKSVSRELTPIPKSPVRPQKKSPEKLFLHDESSNDSDCCVVEASGNAHRKNTGHSSQIIALDSDSSDDDMENNENSDLEVEQSNFLFFEDKNGSYAMKTPQYKNGAPSTLGRSASIICLEDSEEIATTTTTTVDGASTSKAVEPVTKRFEKFTTNEAVEDSVEFLGETRPKKLPSFGDPAPDFIRLEENVPAPKKPLNFYKARKEVRNAVNTNVKPGKAKHWINPAAMQSEKRLVVIDGNNVCHLKTAPGFFSVKRLQTVIKYFEMRSHEIKVVVPDYRMLRFKSSNHEVMQQLFDDGKIVLTPCKRFKDKKTESIYDDRVILQIAVEFDGVVISGDNFRDITGEDKERDKIIAERVIAPIWVTDDMVMMPEDPYGRFGPKLKEILHRIVVPRKPKT